MYCYLEFKFRCLKNHEIVLISVKLLFEAVFLLFQKHFLEISIFKQLTLGDKKQVWKANFY